jgi:hypothetical protein
MTLVEAAGAMKEGKKIKRKHWHKSIYVALGRNLVFEMHYDGINQEYFHKNLYIFDIEADDWEITE